MLAQAPAPAPSVEAVSSATPESTTFEGEVRVTVEVFVSDEGSFAVLRGRCSSDGDVVLVGSPARPLLTRSLLYTALTRARTLCVFVGDRRRVALAVRSAKRGGRHAGLTERLGDIRCRT